MFQLPNIALMPSGLVGIPPSGPEGIKGLWFSEHNCIGDIEHGFGEFVVHEER